MTSVQYENWFVKLLLIIWLFLIVICVTVEITNAQESYPPIIWIQAHLYSNGWGMECQKGCEHYNQLGNQNELDMRFPNSWMVINWYYYLFNRKYCATTGVCLEPLPEPMKPLRTLSN